MDFKTNALLLRAADYGENDKMVTLLTAERGKIGAAVKGVKKAGAKLRFAAQPFCFAEYVLAERGGRRTVISASLHDAFYTLCEDVEKFYAGAAVSEACDRVALEGMPAGDLLVAAVSALKGVCLGKSAALVRFYAQALTFAGYPVQARDCPVCGKLPAGRMRFRFSDGAFYCADCGGEEGVPASESTFLCLRAVAAGADEAPRDGVVRALRLLKAYASYHLQTEFPALDAYLRCLHAEMPQ